MPPATFAVLTSAPESAALTDACLAAACEGLGKHARIADIRWLAPREACEIRIEADHVSTVDLRNMLAQAIGSAPVDVNVIRTDPASHRKRLLCADMESTIIREELIDEMSDLAGRRAEMEQITASAMRGDIDFAQSLRQRVRLLRGIRTDTFDTIRARVTLMPGARTLVRTMAAHGATAALVSGGFTLFADEIARDVGFHAVAANVLDIADGALTGTVREPVLGPDEKAETLKRIAGAHGLGLSDTIAVGDGANDIAMLDAAGLGVAFRAKPVLVERARASETGAIVLHGDLTALLYLQGYTSKELLP